MSLVLVMKLNCGGKPHWLSCSGALSLSGLRRLPRRSLDRAEGVEGTQSVGLWDPWKQEDSLVCRVLSILVAVQMEAGQCGPQISW